MVQVGRRREARRLRGPVARACQAWFDRAGSLRRCPFAEVLFEAAEVFFHLVDGALGGGSGG